MEEFRGFDTEFLHDVLKEIAADLPTRHITHVGSVDSWPHQQQQLANAMLIFNTHYATQPGQHWFAVYITGSTAFLFDSMRLHRPFPQIVLSKLSQQCKKIINVVDDFALLQDPWSPMCGIHCLAFLERAAHRKTFKLCNESYEMNDIIAFSVVLPYIKKVFRL